jgi:hypothetical protein
MYVDWVMVAYISCRTCISYISFIWNFLSWQGFWEILTLFDCSFHLWWFFPWAVLVWLVGFYFSLVLNLVWEKESSTKLKVVLWVAGICRLTCTISCDLVLCATGGTTIRHWQVWLVEYFLFLDGYMLTSIMRAELVGWTKFNHLYWAKYRCWDCPESLLFYCNVATGICYLN